jgi:Intracellular proteinase inhibitor
MCERTPAPVTANERLIGRHMSTRYIIPLLVAGSVALACGSRSHSESAAAVPKASLTLAPVVAPVPAPTPKHVKLTEGASSTLSSAFHVSHDKRKFHFALDVTNPGKKHLELNFPSGQEYEFSVLDVTGKEVFRWSAAKMFTQSRQNRLLDGGDTMHIEEDGPAELPLGSYVAVATLRSANFPLQERVAFEMR